MIRCNEININNNVRFSNIILENLNKTALKKVRIKVDPALINSGIDLSKVNGYEGYVLHEGLKSLKILVLAPEMSVEEIPSEVLEVIAAKEEQDTFDEFKAFLINELIKNGKPENDPLIDNINNSNCINEIELYAKQGGFTGDNLSELYKRFILTDEN